MRRLARVMASALARSMALSGVSMPCMRYRGPSVEIAWSSERRKQVPTSPAKTAS